MIVVDSFVWIDHFRKKEQAVTFLLERRKLLVHPFAAGEVLIGNLTHRGAVARFLGNIEQIGVVTHSEAMERLATWKAFERGIGWIDLHLLVSTEQYGAHIWTRDKRLGALADTLGLRFVEP